VAACLFALGAAAGAAWAPPPAPTAWVTDKADFLTPSARSGLDAQLESYERTSGHQVLVYITPSLEGGTPEDFSARSFAAWRVGRKGIDDGLVLFVFAAEHQIRIEVGYGLEDKVPDLVASRVIREIIAPKLQAKDPDGAVRGGIEALIRSIGGEADAVGGPPLRGVSQPAPTAPVKGFWAALPPGMKVLCVLLGLLVLAFLVTHPVFAMELLWMVATNSSSGGGGGSGGGSFSGGGGGSGGGGATGSW
jgi:uncharacterized protein